MKTVFPDGFQHYLQASGCAKKTVESYCKDLELYFRFAENFRKDPYSTETSYFYFSYLSSVRKLAASTVERKRASLVRFSEYLKIRDKSRLVDIQKIKAPRKAKTLPNHFFPSEIEKNLNSLDKTHPLEHRNYFFMLLLWGTGLRLSEILKITPTDIQEKTGALKVLGKGGKERIVYLPRKVLAEYKIYQARFKKEIEASGSLFFNSRKQSLSARGAQWIVEQIGKKTKSGKKWHPHAFRHSFATGLLENGADVRKVAELLGHSSLDTTQKYTHLTRRKLREVHENFHPHGQKNSGKHTRSG